MLTYFFKKILPLVILLAVLVEGTDYGLYLLQLPSDAAVVGGVLLVLGTWAAVASFGSWYYKGVK